MHVWQYILVATTAFFFIFHLDTQAVWNFTQNTTTLKKWDKNAQPFFHANVTPKFSWDSYETSTAQLS